jgi:antitoxin component of MazEF toxin-antitoxin module
MIIHRRRYQLLDLVRGITRKNRQAAVKLCAPRGKEAW